MLMYEGCCVKMSRLVNACAVVCFLTFFLPNCLASVEDVLTSNKGNASVDKVISHRQPLSTNTEVTEEAAALMLMQSDQSFPDDPETVCGDKSINVKINAEDADNLRVLARE